MSSADEPSANGPSGDGLEDLLSRVGLGERAAFSALYDATAAKLFGLCLRILKDRTLAEEALQEIYVKIWHNSGRYQPGRGAALAWLLTVARNHAIDRLRQLRAAQARDAGEGAEPDSLAATDPGPAEQLAMKQDRARIAGCLGELDPARAQAVQLAYFEGYTYAELADRFTVPLNTMRTWLRRSLMALKECLTR